MKDHLHEHKRNIMHLIMEQRKLYDELLGISGEIFGRFWFHKILNLLQWNNTQQLTTKLKKLKWLGKKQKPLRQQTFQVPIINLSSEDLNLDCLKYGLQHSFINKNKFVREELAAEFELFAEKADKMVDNEKREEFHEYLRKQTDTLSQNIYFSKDNMFKSTKQLRENENIVLLSGDKDTRITIMNKTDYQNKVQKMINDGISEGKYVHTEDTIIKDLSSFQSFLLRHFKDHPQYKDMRPSNNQPARLFATAKTHKFHNRKDANLKELKLRPIIDQTGTCYYHAGKVIANYLKPLIENDYIINDTQRFPSMLNDLPPLNEEEEEEVSYDVESLFTSVPVKDTIAFICSEIYEKKKLKPICSRNIFRKLLLELTTECIFTANNKLYKQTDGVLMGGPLSVTFTGCFMNNMEQQIVVPRNPPFYKRFVDDTYRRRKKGVTDEMFTAMNTFHPNIKLTIEQNSTQFLDTQINRSNGPTSFSVVNKDTKLPFHWSSKVPIQHKRNVIKA